MGATSHLGDSELHSSALHGIMPNKEWKGTVSKQMHSRE